MKKRVGLFGVSIAALILVCGTVQAQMVIESVDPPSAEVGSDTNITIYGGADCNFEAYALELSFEPAGNITHTDLAAQGYNVLTTQIHIPSDTTPGVQTVVVTANAMDCTGLGVFEVTCSSCSSGSIVSISPDSGNQGSNLDIAITGDGTHFDASSTVEFDGGGIQVQTVIADSETSLSAAISISPDAALGTRTVTVSTGSQIATGQDMFSVNRQPIDISPSEGTQGELLPSVTITGGSGGYGSTSEVDLGEGIQIQSFSSPADDTLVLSNIQIAQDAYIGRHTLDLVVSGQRYSYPEVFSVLQGANTLLLSVSPDHADRSHPGLEISLVGRNTHFDNPDVQVLISGSSVMASPGEVTDSSHMTANMVIGNSATQDVRDISVEIGCAGGICVNPHEQVTLQEAFTITEPGTLDSAVPSNITAGQSHEVVFSATDGQFEQDVTRLVFDPSEGIEVDSISVSDANHLTATLTISDTAQGDPRDIKAVTATEVAIGEDLVDVENPSIDLVSPGSAFQGIGVSITISGTDIPFAQDTTVEISGAGVNVSGVSFDPEKPDQIIAATDISHTASIGHRDVTISTTAGITVTAKGAFNILAKGSGNQTSSGCNCSSSTNQGVPWLVLTALMILAISFYRRR